MTDKYFHYVQVTPLKFVIYWNTESLFNIKLQKICLNGNTINIWRKIGLNEYTIIVEKYVKNLSYWKSSVYYNVLYRHRLNPYDNKQLINLTKVKSDNIVWILFIRTWTDRDILKGEWDLRIHSGSGYGMGTLYVIVYGVLILDV